jgi:hypothetical protein
LKLYPIYFLEGRKETTTNFCQDGWCPGRYLNPGPPEYEAGVLNWNRYVVTISRYCPSIFTEELRKTAKKINQDRILPERYSNPGYPKYEANAHYSIRPNRTMKVGTVHFFRKVQMERQKKSYFNLSCVGYFMSFAVYVTIKVYKY